MEKATAPADPAGAFERVSRKRARRRAVRRAQGMALAVTVLAVTSTATFVLGRMFGSRSDQAADTPAPSQTPVAEIAFSGEVGGKPGIYSMRADGSEVRRLTKDPGLRINPSWSPDGTQLAYESDRDGDSEIYVLDLATGEERQVTDDPADDLTPAWSPDGTKIAFVSHRDGNSDLYWIAADGDEAGGSGVSRLTASPGADYDPAWSVDGTRIYFAHEPLDGEDPPDLYLLNVPSASRPEPPPPTPLKAGGAYQPAASPDGTRVAFVSDRTGVSQIFVADATGSAVRQVTRDPTNKSSPSWSPGGRRIVFSAGDEEDRDLFVINADGSGLHRLTEDLGKDVTPSWNPRAGSTQERDRGSEGEARCLSEDEAALEPSLRKPGSLRGDIDGDGNADEVSVAVDPQATGSCRYFLVVATSGAITAARIAPSVVGPNEDALALEALVQLDAEPGLEIVVDVWRGAATDFAAVFTMRDKIPILFTVEGFQPTEDTVAYGGSLSGLSGVDCTDEPGVIVLGKAFRQGKGWVVEREFLVVEGTVFRPEPARAERHRLSDKDPLDERFAEFEPIPFPSCAGAIRTDGS